MPSLVVGERMVGCWVEGLIDPGEVDAAVADLSAVIPSADALNDADDPRARDWIGYTPLGRMAPSFWFQQLVAAWTPDQLTALGIPGPGHPYWTERILTEFALMCPGIDTAPWGRRTRT